jgi:hypothetical protein
MSHDKISSNGISHIQLLGNIRNGFSFSYHTFYESLESLNDGIFTFGEIYIFLPFLHLFVIFFNL